LGIHNLGTFENKKNFGNVKFKELSEILQEIEKIFSRALTSIILYFSANCNTAGHLLFVRNNSNGK